MANLLREVAYCHNQAQRYYENGDFVGGAYYEDEIGRMTEAACKSNLINEAQRLRLNHYGRL